MKLFHIHKYDYERHNSLIIRSCDCGLTEEVIIIEEPQLTATSHTRQKDINAVKWIKI